MSTEPMTQGEYWEVFLLFLEINGAKDEYLDNLDQPVNWIRIGNPSAFIMSAFDWSRTDQGSDYWERLHLKWEDTVERLRN